MTEHCLTCPASVPQHHIAFCDPCLGRLEVGANLPAVTNAGDLMEPILLGAALDFMKALFFDDECRREAEIFIAAVRRR